MNSDVTRVWQNLTLYENTALVRNLYQRKHGGSMNATKARQVASQFAQGRQYYESAAGAGDLVRPLILFYGTMALSRGLVMFLDQKISTIKGTHGLSEKAWDRLDTEPEKLPHAQVEVGATGTFPELCRVTENEEICEISTETFPQSVIRAKYRGTSPIPSGSVTTIKEILAQIPDLSELYEETFDEHSLCLPCDIRANPTFDTDPMGSGRVIVYETRKGIPDPEWVGEKLGNEYVKKCLIEDTSPLAPTPETRAKRSFMYGQKVQEDPRTGLTEGYNVVRSRSTGCFYLRLPSEDLTASNIVALYLVAFATGSLVRYHPGYWMSVVSRSKGGSTAPILAAAVSTVEDQFPRLILERLQ